MRAGWLHVAVAVAMAMPSTRAASRWVSPAGVANTNCTEVAPCRSIQQAVDLAGSTDTIELLPGVYSMTEGVFLHKSLTIRASQTGSSTIDCEGRSISAFVLDSHDSAFVDYNVTMTGFDIRRCGGEVADDESVKPALLAKYAGAHLFIENVSFLDCRRAVLLRDTQATLRNVAVKNGGGSPNSDHSEAIVDISGSRSVVQSDFLTVSYSQGSPAVRVYDGAIFNCSSCQFLNNSAAGTCFGKGECASPVCVSGATARFEHSDFVGNSAENGGAMFADNSSSVTILNSNFSRNVANSSTCNNTCSNHIADRSLCFLTGAGGALNLLDLVHLQINATRFEGNSASSIGTAVHLRWEIHQPSSSMSIVQTQFIGNRFFALPAVEGSFLSIDSELLGYALYVAPATIDYSNDLLLLTHSSFVANVGGGLALSTLSLEVFLQRVPAAVVDECHFSENICQSENQGTGEKGLSSHPALLLYGPVNPVISNSVFQHNACEKHPAMVVRWHALPQILNSSFVNNSASVKDGAGAIDLWPTVGADFTNCTFSRNCAPLGVGGAVRVRDTDLSVSFNSCIFLQNYADQGGAVHLGSPGDVVFQDTDFLENGKNYLESLRTFNSHMIESYQGTVYGGALFITGTATPQIRRSRFLKNRAVYGGAAFMGDRSAPIFDDCTFEYNEASLQGGALCTMFYGTKPVIKSSKFSHNSATKQGGAIILDSGAAMQVYNSEIVNNTAGEGVYGAGEGIYVQYGDLTLASVTLDEIYLTGARVTTINCSVSKVKMGVSSCGIFTQATFAQIEVDVYLPKACRDSTIWSDIDPGIKRDHTCSDTRYSRFANTTVPGQLSLKSKGQVFTPYNASIFGLVPGPHDFVVNASEGDHLVTGMEMFHFISDWIEGLVPSPNCTALDDISGAFSCAATKTVSRSCHSSAHTHVVFLVLSNIVDIHLWLSILSIFLNVMFVCAVADLFVAAASVLDNGYSWRSYLHLHYFARLLVVVYSAKGLGGPRTLRTSGELIQHQQE